MEMDQKVEIIGNIHDAKAEKAPNSFTVKTFFAEFIGTFGLTFIACGVAVLSNVDMVATPLAFGLVIIAMAFIFGNISGCHINPAVSLAFLIMKKLSGANFGLYILAQILGGYAGSIILGLCLRGNYSSLGSNSIQSALKTSDGLIDGWSYAGAILVEIVLTFIFCMVILAVCDEKNYKGKYGGVIIGLTLTLCVAMGLRLTGTSVNPARSLAPASLEAIANLEPIKEIWIFIISPLCGGALAAWIYGLFTQ